MARDLIKPKKLKKGATIAFMAPSSQSPKEETDPAKVELEKRGYKVVIHPQSYEQDFMSAGKPEQKVAALHDVFSDPKIDAVFALRGGYQAIHLLDRIDYDVVRNNPKIFVGYSDITALHSAILERSRVVSFLGPNGANYRFFADEKKADAHKTLLNTLDFLEGNVPDNLFRETQVKTIQSGNAEGILWGGNLQLLCALIQAGSRYHPPLDKTILMIEDVGEEIAKLDTQLGGWRLRGIFKNLAGLVIGHMTDTKDTAGLGGVFGYSFEDVIRRHTSDMVGPVVIGAPFGHEYPNYVFPQGLRAKLKADKKAGATLSLTESPFAD